MYRTGQGPAAAERQSGALPALPAADPEHRCAWRTERRRLESRRSASTPDGEQPDRFGRTLSSTLRWADRGLRLVGAHHLFAARARRLRLTRLELSFPRLPPALDGYRILHLSDPHFDGVPGLGAALAGLVRGIDADLCAITGDFRFVPRGPFVQASVLRDLDRLVDTVAPRDGFLAVLGNHDPHDIVEPVEARGIRLLANERVAIARGGARLVVVGTDDVHRFYTPQAQAALASYAPDPATFGLALVHSADLGAEAAACGFDLYLSGHTHGGQICLPGGRPLVVQLRRARGRARGLWREGDMTGYTSRGIGTSGVPIRLFCPGEATLLTLRRGGAGPDGSHQ